jgi:5-methylcytosine-specific restriction endonuclease McrA
MVRPLNAIEIRICTVCSTDFIKGRNRSGDFCSLQCNADHRQTVFIRNWLDGNEQGQRGEGVSERIRKWLHEKHNSSCQHCGWSKINLTTGKIPLTINHIDGNWQNNRPENLELICPNCHSLTSNYGVLNKGNGRPNRLKAVREKMIKYQ